MEEEKEIKDFTNNNESKDEKYSNEIRKVKLKNTCFDVYQLIHSF